MRKTFYVLSALTLASVQAMAQNTILYNYKKYATSEQTVVDSHRWMNNDLENTQAYMARSTVSLLDFLTAKGDTMAFGHLRRPESNLLSVSVSNANTPGQFLHYEGKRRTFADVLAGGEMHIDGVGTLYGMASYQSGMTTQSSFNYATHPEDVAPYFVSDSVGCSKMQRETYTVMGGYSFRKGKLNFGLEAFYEGIALSRTRNPRLANYSHRINVGFGASLVMPRDIVALRFSPEWSRQSMTATSLQDGLRFFEFYGFGLWNRRETQGATAYGRQHSFLGLGTEVSWMHDGSWNWALSASWLRRTMDSEEASFKELFASTTNHMQQQVVVSHGFGSTSLYLQLTAGEHLRKGREAIYQQQVIDADAGLVDYVKVGTNSLYTQNQYDADLRVKVLQAIGTSSSVGLVGSGTYRSYEDRYVSPQMSIKNNVFVAGVSAEYATRRKGVELETSIGTSVQCGMDNDYGVAGAMNKVQNVMSYVPFLLRGENSHALEGQMRMAFRVSPKLRVGCRLDAKYASSDYRKVIVLNLGTSLFF